MLRAGLTVLMAITLTACSTPTERAARVQAEVDQMVAIYGPACDKLGFTKDTDPWRECILQLATRDEQRLRTRPTTTTCVGHRGFYNCTSF